MSSLFKKPSLNNSKGRNGFDMSRRRIFSSPLGMLQPVYFDFANPGEKYKLNSTTFIRTEPVETAALVRFKAHVEWFFVPMKQLYELWSPFFYHTNDINSSLYDTDEINLTYLPCFDAYPFIKSPDESTFLMSPSTTTGVYNLNLDPCGIPYMWHFRRLYDLLGYGSVEYNNYTGDNKARRNIFPYLAYHKIFYSHYNMTDWFPNRPSMYNANFKANLPEYSVAEAAPILSTMHYRRWRTDYFNNIIPNPTFSSSFASALGNFLPNETLNQLINPESVLNAGVGATYSNKLTLKNFTQVSQPGANSPTPDITLQSVDINGFPGGSAFGMTDLSIPTLRAGFALDRLLRITAFAGGHYDEQTLAHFGYKPPTGLSEEVYFLGEQTVDVDITQVVATSGSDGENSNVLGEVAGKGYAFSGNSDDLNFECPWHGYVMAIFSIEPIPDYASTGCEIVNRSISPYDFFLPELDNLGMQPQFGDFLRVVDTSNDQNMTGWEYRYSQFKTSFDVVNESMWNTYRRSWVGVKQENFLNGDASVMPLQQKFFIFPQYANNIFAMQFPYFTNATGNKKPTWQPDADDWLASNWCEADNIYGYDNFICMCDFKVYKTSEMSVHSLPKL